MVADPSDMTYEKTVEDGLSRMRSDGSITH
jgi:hypothetical protein